MLIQNYKRYGVTFVRGEGSYLFDDNGKKYLDMSSGIGVNSIGYAHPKWVAAVSGQAGKLAHISNLFHSQPAEELAERIAGLSEMDGVFFGNSGAEANEALIKLARKYSYDKYGRGRDKIATLKNSFHGRTITTLAATGQDKFHDYFFPFTEGFYHIDAEGEVVLEDGTAAVLIEVVQGEGGICPLEEKFLKDMQAVCKEKDILFMIDEVQTGFGRTGEWFAYQHYGLEPDAISFAKGVGGGLPIGGIAVKGELAGVFTHGTHGTTFGGNPIACAAAMATIDVIEGILGEVSEKGEALQEVHRRKFGNSRGMGLMLGCTVGEGLDELVEKLLAAGVVPLVAGNGTLRLLPPLTITMGEIEEYGEILDRVIK